MASPPSIGRLALLALLLAGSGLAACGTSWLSGGPAEGTDAPPLADATRPEAEPGPPPLDVSVYPKDAKVAVDAPPAPCDMAPAKAEAKVVKPDAKVVKPDAKVAEPDAPGVMKADAKAPDSKVAKADSKVVKADSKVVKADSKVVKADSKVASPDSKVASPDTGAVAYTGSFPTGTGYLSATLVVGGTSRAVSLYRPSSLGSSPPLLITFHGTNDDATYMISASYAKDLADAKGVIVASPSARTMTTGDWDNHVAGDRYWETAPSVSPKTNPDLLLVAAIIEEAVKAYGVDPKRVYTLGHSNGAFFSMFAAMTLPNSIAAFAECAGGLVDCATTASCSFVGTATTCAALATASGWCSCSGAEKPVPVATSGRLPPGYLTHSNDDTKVSVYYTCALSSRMQTLGYSLSTKIYSGGGHSMPYGFASTAWTFLSTTKLP
jgi:predicted esterase